MKMVRSSKCAINLAMLCVTLVCCAVFAGFAYAEDALPPSWRGLSNTTFQDWAFNVPDNCFLGVPDVYSNQYGNPIASSNNGWTVIDGKVLLDSSSHIFLTIPNHPSSSLNDYTLVSLQITYLQREYSVYNGSEVYHLGEGKPAVYALYEEPSQGKPIDDLPGVLVDEHDVLLNTDGDSSWRLWQSVWRVEPSQALTFRICRPFVNADCSFVRLDDVVVDTQYVPEPSSILALLCGVCGMAGFAMRGRNGRR